jgi:hypothetical protein
MILCFNDDQQNMGSFQVRDRPEWEAFQNWKRFPKDQAPAFSLKSFKLLSTTTT